MTVKTLETFSGRRASQNYYELTAFIENLKDKKVINCLGIGTCHGDTFHFSISSIPRGSKGVAVDLQGDLGYSRDSVISPKSAINDLNEYGYDCSCILGDSKDPAILEQVDHHGPYYAILLMVTTLRKALRNVAVKYLHNFYPIEFKGGYSLHVK